MKEIISDQHINLTKSLKNIEQDLLSINGLLYYRLIGQIYYPKNSYNSGKYYLISIEYNEECIPVNLLAEKPTLDDALHIFFKHIKKIYPRIQYPDEMIFNILEYKTPDKIYINKYYMKDIITPPIKYVYFDWGSTLGKPGKSQEFYRTHDKDNLNNGTLELLQNLHSRNIPMGIISNRSIGLEEFQHHLGRAGLLKYFNNIILSSDGYSKKPSSDMFIQGIKDTKIHPKYMLYVGNNYMKDIISATKNGYQTAYKINDKKAYEYNNISNHNIYNMNELINLI